MAQAIAKSLIKKWHQSQIILGEEKICPNFERLEKSSCWLQTEKLQGLLLFVSCFVCSSFFLPSFVVDEAVSRSRTNSQRFKLSFWFFFINLSGCDRFRSVFRVHLNVFQPKSLQRNPKKKKKHRNDCFPIFIGTKFSKKKSERRKKKFGAKNIRSLFRGGMFLKTRSIHEKRKNG